MRRGFIGQFTTPRSVAAVPAGNPLPARLPAPPATRRFRNIFLPKDVNPAPAGPEGCPGCASPNCARICYENGRLRRVGIVIFHSYARRTVRPVTGLPRAAEQGDFVGDVPLFRIYSQLSGHHDPILGSFRRLRITSEQGVLMLVRNGGFTLYEEKARRLFCYDATAAAAIVAIRTFLEATP
jgi:hypothetical protein